MNINLPINDDLEKTQKQVKKFGLPKYLSLQLLSNWWKLFLEAMAIMAISAGVSYLISFRVTNSIKNKIKTEVKNEITQYFVLSEDTSKEAPSLDKTLPGQKSTPEGEVALRDFKNGDWIFSKAKYDLTDDGFYCPKTVGFPSWFMWTKKFLVEQEVQIRFKLKDETKDNEKPPTLYLSYGDKTSEAPEVFYRVNVLDGDFQTLRVYDGNNNPVGSARAPHQPDLKNDLVIILKPSVPNPNRSNINLNPELSFKIENDETYIFIPEKEFNLGIPLVSLSQQGDGKQIGVGVSKGDCFKIISSNLY